MAAIFQVGNNNVENESNNEDEEQTKERENIEHKNQNPKKYETTHKDGQRKKRQEKSDDSDIEHVCMLTYCVYIIRAVLYMYFKIMAELLQRMFLLFVLKQLEILSS